MMDDTEDDVIYNSSSAGGDHQDQEGFDRGKGAEREGSYTRLNNEYNENQGEDEDDEEDEAPEELVEEEDEDDDEDGDSVQRIRNNVVNDGDADDVDEGFEEKRSEYKRRIEDINFERHPKKRRLNNLISKYEFAPRVAQAQPSSGAIVACPPPPPPPPAPKLSFGGRSALADWTEHETFVLLDAWGDRFLQHGRKSLRSEEWKEVALKVSQESKTERTDTQCRNRLDTLKKKYKKEKAKFGGAGGNSSKWIYFKKMDVLMSPTPKQPGLSCGVDSGEYVFSNPRVYLNRANGLDEMRDSPGHSDSTENDADDSDGLPPRRKKPAKISNLNTINKNDCTPMNLLADCLQNFSKIYEKVESSKRQQMGELEKMRMDFHRDLEQQKKLILERAQAEIAKIWQSDNEENGASAENISS